MALMGDLGPYRGNLFIKNMKSKIVCQTPFNRTLERYVRKQKG
jgi:hypothetical protein